MWQVQKYRSTKSHTIDPFLQAFVPGLNVFKAMGTKDVVQRILLEVSDTLVRAGTSP
jgi:hypothetical protein